MYAITGKVVSASCSIVKGREFVVVANFVIIRTDHVELHCQNLQR